MKLCLYDDCPFCAKVRAIFGMKETPFELVTLLIDNTAMPLRKIRRKMAPILENEGRVMPESHVGAIRREHEQRHHKLTRIGG